MSPSKSDEVHQWEVEWRAETRRQIKELDDRLKPLETSRIRAGLIIGGIVVVAEFLREPLQHWIFR